MKGVAGIRKETTPDACGILVVELDSNLATVYHKVVV